MNKINETLDQYKQKQLTEGYKMKKAIVLREKVKTEILPIIGGLTLVLQLLILQHFAGYNLTPFLGSASRFSPIVFGLIGSALLNSK